MDINLKKKSINDLLRELEVPKEDSEDLKKAKLDFKRHLKASNGNNKS